MLASDDAFGIFPSFFHGGFECSTALTSQGVRLDELRSTGHEQCVLEDYRALRTCGMRVAREGVRWHVIDCRGRLDFASVLPFVHAAEAEGITCIWDLFHYGYPDDLDPFSAPFSERFAAYCGRFARLLSRRGHGERGVARAARFYTVVNEISFFAWAGGDAGLFAPFARGRAAELKRCLAAAAIAGMNAIRAADPLARFVNCDPLVHVVAPWDAPELAADAHFFNENYVCEAWDMLAGRTAPELGGSPAHLDIVGVNYYGVNQWEHTRPENVLDAADPRRMPLHRLLEQLYARYEHPIVLTETSSIDDHRPAWLQHTTSQCVRAMRSGVDLHGLCIYPVVGMCDWYDHSPRCMGLWDWEDGDCCTRRAHAPSHAALQRAQQSVSRHLSRPARAHWPGTQRSGFP